MGSTPLLSPIWLSFEQCTVQVGEYLPQGSRKFSYVVRDSLGRDIQDLPDEQHKLIRQIHEMTRNVYFKPEALPELQTFIRSMEEVQKYHYDITAFEYFQDAILDVGVAGTVAFFTGGGSVVFASLSEVAKGALKDMVLTAPEVAARNWARMQMVVGMKKARQLERWLEGTPLKSSATNRLSAKTLIDRYDDAMWV